jgi:signal transduction histidine kinase
MTDAAPTRLRGRPSRAATRGDRHHPRGRRSWAFDVVLALFATVAELIALADEGTTVTATGLAVVAGSALVLRRSAPLAVLATILAAGVAVVAVGDSPAGASLLIALYTTAAVCELRVSLAALVPTVVVVAALSAATADTEGRQTSAVGGAIIAAVLTVGIWGLGAYAQTRRRYRFELEQRAAQLEREREQLARIAVHEERASIARELHDIVAHSVSVMLVGVRGARDVLRSSPDLADDTLARVETSGEQSLTELRRILALLRAPALEADVSPQPSLAELEQLVADYCAAGLPVRLEVTGEAQPLSGGVELSVYRIVQEALTNALKHSQPTRVTVTVSFRRTQLEVVIVDDGAVVAQGASTEPGGDERAPRGIGQGIVGMRERVALLGGQLEIGPRAGGGFRVQARLPIDGAT